MKYTAKNCGMFDDEALQEIFEKLSGIAERVENRPLSLAANADKLMDLDRTTDEIQSTDQDRRYWRELCWLARRDMSEEEMLLLTEPTLLNLITAYGHPKPQETVAFWRKLKAKRQEYVNATGGSVVREKNAGDITVVQAAISHKTRALPSGVEAGVYKPEVASPTAMAWKAKAPSPQSFTLARSTKAPSQKAPSVKAPSLKAPSVKAPSTGAKSPRSANQATVQNPGWKR